MSNYCSGSHTRVGSPVRAGSTGNWGIQYPLPALVEIGLSTGLSFTYVPFHLAVLLFHPKLFHPVVFTSIFAP